MFKLNNKFLPGEDIPDEISIFKTNMFSQSYEKVINGVI